MKVQFDFSAADVADVARRPWSDIREILDTPAGIEFVSRAGTLLMVRGRASSTGQERSDFLQLARASAAAAARSGR